MPKAFQKLCSLHTTTYTSGLVDFDNRLGNLGSDTVTGDEGDVVVALRTKKYEIVRLAFTE